MSKIDNRLKAVVEESCNVVVIFDRKKIEYVNDVGKKLLGEDVLKKETRECFSEKEWKKLDEGIMKAEEDNRRWNGETAMFGKDGQLIEMSAMIIAHKDEDGEGMYYAMIGRDIREVKKKEMELDRLKLIVEESWHVVIMFDRNGVLYMNDAAKKFLGEVGLKRQIEEYFPAEQWKKIESKIFSAEHEGEVWSGETMMIRKDGNARAMLVLVTGHKNEASGEFYYSMIGRDIEEMKRREMELSDAKNKAEEASKAKGLFLANMTHDIRAPLNAILGFSELLGSMPHDKETEEYYEVIKTSGKNLLGLTSDILDLSKIESGKLELKIEPVNLHELLNEVKSTFILNAKQKDLELAIDDRIKSSTLYLDALRMRQVLFNLVGNAIKYTNRGTVTLICEENIQEGGYETTLIFTVKDTGQGIREEDQKRLFTDFVQCHDPVGGVGLGLSIVNKLVAAMGGTIDLKSEVGRGSEFKVTIPEVKRNDGDLEEEVEENEGIEFENPLILMADDMPSNVQVLRAFLKDTNVRFLEASNGRETVKLAKMYKPDVVLMDIEMPEMDGYDATKELKADEDTQKIPLIVITAKALAADREKAMNAGAQEFLRKPTSRAALLRELKKLLPFRKIEKQ